MPGIQGTSSYASPSVGHDQVLYDSDPYEYNNQWASYEDDTGFSLFGKTGLGGFGGGDDDDSGFKIIGLAVAAIIPAVIAIAVIAIIIAVIVEIKNLSTAVTVAKSRSYGGWLDSIANSLNEVDSERMLYTMFPGGFNEVVQSIEGAYRQYRGLDTKQDHTNKQRNKKSNKETKQ